MLGKQFESRFKDSEARVRPCKGGHAARVSRTALPVQSHCPLNDCPMAPNVLSFPDNPHSLMRNTVLVHSSVPNKERSSWAPYLALSILHFFFLFPSLKLDFAYNLRVYLVIAKTSGSASWRTQ